MNTRLKILTPIVNASYGITPCPGQFFVIEDLPMMRTGKIDFPSVSELVNDKVDYPDAN